MSKNEHRREAKRKGSEAEARRLTEEVARRGMTARELQDFVSKFLSCTAAEERSHHQRAFKLDADL